MNIFYKRLKDLPVNDVAGVVGKLADPWARLHRYEYSGGVGRAIKRERHVVRCGMRLNENREEAIKRARKSDPGWEWGLACEADQTAIESRTEMTIWSHECGLTIGH